MTIAASPRCPRCGYDQRGVVAAWNDSCPLHGTCSECGLIFNWAEVLVPQKFEPLWCVEFSKPSRVLWAAIRTLIRSFWPWKFWRDLQMSYAIRWRRLALYMLLLLGTSLWLYVLAQTAIAVYVRHDIERTISQRFTSYTINHSYFDAIVEAVATPLAGRSSGWIQHPQGSFPYIAPIELQEHLQRSLWGPGRRTNIDARMVFATIMLLVVGMLMLLAFPVTLILLPVSRKRAKVRWAHIIRVTTYSIFIPPLTVIACLVVAFACIAAGTRSLSAMIAFGAVIPIFNLLWWWAALKNYLKIPHSFAVAILLSILLWLLTPMLIVMVAITFAT